MKKLITLLSAFLFLVSMHAQNVYEIIQASPNHTILEAAIDAAELGPTLSGAGPFTVFAPDDAAFNALGQATIDALLANPMGDLTQILLYHVIGGTVVADDLELGLQAATVQGGQVTIGNVDADFFVNQALITGADIPASNGVLHVTNAVITPPTSLMDVIANSPIHNTLEELLVVSGLDATVAAANDVTIFAPEDGAFDILDPEIVNGLIANPDGLLTRILLNHVFAGVTTAAQVPAQGVLTSLADYNNPIGIEDNEIAIGWFDGVVIAGDVSAPGGIIHMTDELVFPFDLSVYETTTRNDDLSTLAGAIELAELDGPLSDLGSEEIYTIFAPNNAAFAALDQDLLNEIIGDPTGKLADVLGFHVLDDAFFSFTLEDGDSFETINGQDVEIAVNADGIFVNGAKVLDPNYTAVNGLVHIIEDVLLPLPNTVVDIVVDSPNHESLEDAVIAAELAGALSGEGPFTVFAPDDAAFAALGQATLDALFADPTGDLADILQLHVVADEAFAADLSDGDELTSLTGEKLLVTINADGVFINDSKVTAPDLAAANGVVHVVDKVILPRPTVVEIVVASPDHESLEDAVIAAELAETLSGEGPFTVFAPDDDAFAALGQATIDALFADPTGELAEILKLHVVAGQAFAADLSDGDELTSLTGEKLLVKITPDGVFINESKVTVPDLEAVNGVVHVIDKVILPRPTVVDIIVNSPDHEILEDAVIAADLAGTLSGEGPFTVFAPTDAAFNELGTELINELLADPAGDLTTILTYHVAAGEIFSTDLMNSTYTMLSTETITVNIDNGVVINGTAMVTGADLKAKNGVVHVIDAVLIPLSVATTDLLPADFEFGIYPNPASTAVMINVEELANPADSRLELYNALGQLVKTTANVQSTTSWDIAEMTKGQYFLRLVTPEGSAIKTLQIVR